MNGETIDDKLREGNSKRGGRRNGLSDKERMRSDNR